MKVKGKNILCGILSVVLSLGMLTGCGADKKIEGSDSKISEDTSGAKGRYLESDVPLPEDTAQIYDMVKLEDGTIRIATEYGEGQKAVWNLKEDGNTWEKVYELPDEWKEEEGFYIRIALSPKGNAFVFGMQLDESGETEADRYYQLDSSGGVEEVSLQIDDYIYSMQYTQEGDLLLATSEQSVCKVQMENGEVEQNFFGADGVSYFGCAGSTVYLVTYDGGILPYDGKTGEPLEKDEGLSESVIQSGADISLKVMGCMPLAFAGGEEEDEVFFCSDKGLYRHIKNGSVSELVIDGSLTSIGNPAIGVTDLAAADHNEFYLSTMTDVREPALLRYTYSKDAAAVPESQLRVWTLYENSELKQNISQYQKKEPEAYINLEVGVTEDNGVTDSDALKNLSTEIMAGNGPDLLVLDGLPVDSYMEKGLLEDVTDVAGGAEGLFENLMHAVEQEGKIYGIPLRFALPLVETEGAVLESIHDLQSFADAVEELKERDTDQAVFTPYYNGTYLAAQLYDSCSPVWLKEDGNLAEEQLEEFYTQLCRIYDPDSVSNELEEMYTSSISESMGYNQYVSAIGSGTLELYSGKTMINFGNILSLMDLAMISTTMDEKGEIQYQPLAGQAEHVYVPKSVMGINSQSKEKEAARQFLEFLLTEDAQKASIGQGLPIQQKALEALAESQEESTIGSGMANDPDSYMEMDVKKLDQQFIDEFVAYVKEADTPAVNNEILRDAVLSQADDCVKGKLTPADAAKKVSENIRLYLAE